MSSGERSVTGVILCLAAIILAAIAVGELGGRSYGLLVAAVGILLVGGAVLPGK